MSLMQTSVIEELVEKAVVTIEEHTGKLPVLKRQALFNIIKGTMDEVLGEFWRDGYREGKKNTLEQYQAKLKAFKETIMNEGLDIG